MNARIPSYLVDRVEEAQALANRRAYEEDCANERTRPARELIKALGPNVSEREICSLLSTIQMVMGKSGFAHSDLAKAADEFLTDAHAALEELIERSE